MVETYGQLKRRVPAVPFVGSKPRVRTTVSVTT
jgi:hypothetical protein